MITGWWQSNYWQDNYWEEDYWFERTLTEAEPTGVYKPSYRVRRRK